MIITPLFVTLLSISGVLAWISWKKRNAILEPQTRQGPVPGYSMTAGEEVALSHKDFEGHPPWRIVTVEEFHSAQRSRLVVTISAESVVGFEPVVRELAQLLQSRVHAHVVFVHCIVEGVVQLQHLYAPDGRGWTGVEPHREITLSSP